MFDYIKTKYEDAPIIISKYTAEKAIKFIKQELKQNKNSAELYCHLSKAYVYSNNNKKALSYAKKAYKLAPDYDYAVARYIYCFFRLGNEANKQILSLMEQLIKKDNFNPVIYSLLAISLPTSQSEYLKYICNKIKSHLKQPNNLYEYEVLIVALLLLRKHKKLFFTLVKKIEKQYTENKEILIYEKISYGYYIFKDYEKSLEYAEKIVRIDPEYYYGYYRLARAHYKLAQYDEALNNFLILEEKWEIDKDDYMCIAHCYDQKKESDLKNSLKYIDKAILAKNDNAYEYYMKGVLYYFSDQFDEALKNFQQAENKGYEQASLYSYMSYIYMKLKNQKKELEYANKAILKDNTYSFAHYRKGFCLYNMGKFDEALESFEMTEKLNYYYKDYYEYMAYIYSLNNNWEQALKYINKQLLTEYNCPHLYSRKAQILQAMGKTELANKNLAKYIQLTTQ